MKGIELIEKERNKQIEKYGYTPEHDSAYKNKELMFGALAYLTAALYGSFVGVEEWPWDVEYFHSTSPNEDLAKAGAFIAAELERRNYIASKESGNE